MFPLWLKLFDFGFISLSTAFRTSCRLTFMAFNIFIAFPWECWKFYSRSWVSLLYQYVFVWTEVSIPCHTVLVQWYKLGQNENCYSWDCLFTTGLCFDTIHFASNFYVSKIYNYLISISRITLHTKFLSQFVAVSTVR